MLAVAVAVAMAVAVVQVGRTRTLVWLARRSQLEKSRPDLKLNELMNQ